MQLLLRVDDALHASLTAQARKRGTSVNALANEILSLAVDPARLTPTDRLRLKLIAVGELGRSRSATTRGAQPGPRTRLRAAPQPRALSADERDAAIAATRGWGAIADELIDDQRGAK